MALAWTARLQSFVGKFTELYEKTKDFAIALRLAPEYVKESINKILSANKEKADLLRSALIPKLFPEIRPKQHERERVR